LNFFYNKGYEVEGGMVTMPAVQSSQEVLLPEQMADLKEGKLAIWAFGYIFYKDTAELHHKNAFCRRYDLAAGRFRNVHDPDLEYDY
jgi:hypothetical protein